jgi:DNA (cytosine-5)-methyltransferase 1
MSDEDKETATGYPKAEKGGLNELALFAGAGGGVLGGKLLGWRTTCAVELDAYAAAVLAQRQNDGCLEPFPIWSDIKTFDGRPWRGIVDVVSGGFPCQDISCAGRGEGITGERSGLWKEMARVVCEVRPQYVLVENSPTLTSRGLGVVLGDLAEMGFDAEWGVFSACSVGQPHTRERLFLLAYPRSKPLHRTIQSKNRRELGWGKEKRSTYWEFATLASGIAERLDKWRKCMGQPSLVRVDDGMGSVMDRLKAIGNGQVPQCMALAWITLCGGIKG